MEQLWRSIKRLTNDRSWPILSVRRSAALVQLSGLSGRLEDAVGTAAPDPTAAFRTLLAGFVLATPLRCCEDTKENKQKNGTQIECRLLDHAGAVLPVLTR
jgi:hypothetical protein